jgi:hypothetical protein
MAVAVSIICLDFGGRTYALNRDGQMWNRFQNMSALVRLRNCSNVTEFSYAITN